MGLPRSGTTLLDRIVSSHSAVDSLGEINDFALSLMGEIGPSTGKLDLIAKSTHMDFDQLGAKYLSSIRPAMAVPLI
ncbi:MAG: sulfotransferase [Alphaproteobacteria bacterium]|nr:sulfotransferase [Alphaproteobacteria bacterium]